ncbi:unnamed protein product [Cylicostephanus goldi]|uniref:Uncharacterized protein n=1 Tax=Cylicostephanus goldi TaxID=71465 RepID=A0A3P6T2J8_CYLGO|nr:unnamed protein product [Cylicostephanus goldi]
MSISRIWIKSSSQIMTRLAQSAFKIMATQSR